MRDDQREGRHKSVDVCCSKGQRDLETGNSLSHGFKSKVWCFPTMCTKEEVQQLMALWLGAHMGTRAGLHDGFQ